MEPRTRLISTFFFCTLLAANAVAQPDEACSEFGVTPSLDSPWARIPYVYGRVTLKGFDSGTKPPKVTMILTDPQQTPKRLILGKSGNYCFQRSTGSGGSLLLDVDGIEVARRSLSSVGAAQQREDFEIFSTASQRSPPPATISAKFFHPQSQKSIELYGKAVEAEKRKEIEKAVKYLIEIVTFDPADFIAWAKLGSLQLEQKAYADAETACRRSLTLKPEYTPAWINAGKIRIAQKQYEAAIEVFKHAVTLDPTSARTHQLLGEAHLLAKQGSLGAEALNAAIKLDPVGMAECHLQLAHLYQLAGAKQLAANEYKMFLKKSPDHPDRKKFEKYVKENPE